MALVLAVKHMDTMPAATAALLTALVSCNIQAVCPSCQSDL